MTHSKDLYLPAVLYGGRNADGLVVDGDEQWLAESVALRVGGRADVLPRHGLAHVLQHELLLVDVDLAVARAELLPVHIPVRGDNL